MIIGLINLGLATPRSVIVGVGKATEAGVLIRNGEALQTASKLTAMVLDKTGTITLGEPKVTDIIVTGKLGEAEVLGLADSLEAGSEHPLAQAIVASAVARELPLTPVDNFAALADVGFAIGTGTNVAIESADITLMRGSLHGLADAIAVSKATLANIRQNLFGAFIYNAAGVPIAAGLLYPFFGVLLNPVIAGAAMAFSSLTVVSNANRPRFFRPQSGVDLAGEA